MEPVNYPPEKIYASSKMDAPNYDHLILWMLYNNDECKWSHFIDEPIKIPIGTLSRHLELLKRKGFVEKLSRGHYKITSEGKQKYHELSSPKKKERALNYPPGILINTGRNYSHWILWMLYNNNYCKRADFMNEPLFINQSSLSKALNFLIEHEFMSKDNGKYLITNIGKIEYSKMLQEYDLDRQTILEEESKKIEEISNTARSFFDKFNVEDKETQFKFLNIILKLDYERVKSLIKDMETYFKVILFLALNHPDNYPNCISSDEFSADYNIKKTTLDYFIEEISEGNLYKTKFFKISEPQNGNYYFQAGEKLERVLQAITENHINRFTYLNKLFTNSNNRTPLIDINLIIEPILEESCPILLNIKLKQPLKEFLPNYIRFLAYKVETRKKLKDSYDKLEGIIWQNMAQIFESQKSMDLEDQYKKEVKELDKQIELHPNDIQLYNTKIKILVYFNKYAEVLNELNKILKTFPENNIEIMMKKASIHKKMKNLREGFKIVENLIKKYPENYDLQSYKAFWYQYIDRKVDAIETIQNVINKEPNNGIYYDNYGEILMYFEEYEEATKKFLKALTINNNAWYTYQTYIKLGICYKALGNAELAIMNLREGKKITKKSTIDPDIKNKWLQIADLFLSQIK